MRCLYLQPSCIKIELLMNISLRKPDTIGAVASTLCVIHCLLTPILFAVQSYTAVHSEVAPLWWKNLDFIFITISFFAINQSTKNSSKKSIQYALWGAWVSLLFLIINEKMEWFHLGELVTYAVALTLAVLHLYNLNYCQCKDENCCHQDLKD